MSTKFYHNKNGVPMKSQDDVINHRESNSIKTMCYNQQRNEILIGDRLGNLYVFDYENYSLLKKISLSTHGIQELKISPKFSLLGVVLNTGEAFLCDCSRNYQKVQTLEQSFEDYTIRSSHFFKGIALIPD
jgi:WD40 repeat protein